MGELAGYTIQGLSAAGSLRCLDEVEHLITVVCSLYREPDHVVSQCSSLLAERTQLRGYLVPGCQRDSLNPRQEFAYHGIRDGAHFLGSTNFDMMCNLPPASHGSELLGFLSLLRKGGGACQETRLTQQAPRPRR